MRCCKHPRAIRRLKCEAPFDFRYCPQPPAAVSYYGCRILKRNETLGKQAEIELFDNPRPQRDYRITIRCPEFTSVCPRTGQPDFGEIVIEYCPDKSCIELKSLKFYMQGYRDKGIFYEALTNDILDDLSVVCKPRWMKVTSRFTPRGGITTEVVAEYKAKK
ncbi:MAG: NADPH-dependent 7-cyano-7-deazaguanine reductase QueF [Phycisphaerales bacterium]|nr:MAG: NADPH-dependent 7-cyano-7-deazaguanine reductase QueF [Phycisphaerales bacterium]